MDKKIWLIINEWDDMPVESEPAYSSEARANQRAKELSSKEERDYRTEWLRLDESEPSGEEHG